MEEIEKTGNMNRSISLRITSTTQRKDTEKAKTVETFTNLKKISIGQNRQIRNSRLSFCLFRARILRTARPRTAFSRAEDWASCTRFRNNSAPLVPPRRRTGSYPSENHGNGACCCVLGDESRCQGCRRRSRHCSESRFWSWRRNWASGCWTPVPRRRPCAPENLRLETKNLFT